jgi:putative redox protein
VNLRQSQQLLTMPKETKATLTWQRGQEFDGNSETALPIHMDGTNRAAPSPMALLLLAAGSCTGADIVSILEKMRVGLVRLQIDVSGTRRDEEPRRYIAIHLTYHLSGTGLDETKARRAIDLSIEKYCSVIHSLAPDIPITYDLVLG